jgi:hypothetical protein
MLDSEAIVAYAKELAYILSESSFLQRKTFLRTFIQKIEVNPETVTVDYTLPIPIDKDRTSSKEVLYINRIGSPSCSIYRTFRATFVSTKIGHHGQFPNSCFKGND